MQFSDLADLTNTVYDRVMTPIEKAKRLGTFNQVDRSPQYQDLTAKELTRGINEAWAKIRRCEDALRDRDRVIADLHERLKVYKLKNIALTAIITGLAWEGLKALVHTLLR